MATTFGITKITGTLIKSVDLTHSAETKVLIAADGTFSAARNVDDSYSFTVSGYGTTAIEAGGSTGAPDGTSGKVIITKVTESQTNDDWDQFSYDGTAYPHAS